MPTWASKNKTSVGCNQAIVIMDDSSLDDSLLDLKIIGISFSHFGNYITKHTANKV